MQKLRKEAELLPSDRVVVFYDCASSSKINEIVSENQSYITHITNLDVVAGKPPMGVSVVICSDDVPDNETQVDGEKFTLYFTKPTRS